MRVYVIGRHHWRVSALSFSSRGRVSAHAGCSPRDSGQLLSSRTGSSSNYISLVLMFLFFYVLPEATVDRRKRLGASETVLHAKEEEHSQAAKECDCLAKELADQAERHKAELQKLKESEANLQAEFETSHSNWA